MMEEKVKRKIARKSTSIKVDPELWKNAKIEAIKHDLELSDLVERALAKELTVLRREK